MRIKGDVPLSLLTFSSFTCDAAGVFARGDRVAARVTPDVMTYDAQGRKPMSRLTIAAMRASSAVLGRFSAFWVARKG